MGGAGSVATAFQVCGTFACITLAGNDVGHIMVTGERICTTLQAAARLSRLGIAF